MKTFARGSHVVLMQCPYVGSWRECLILSIEGMFGNPANSPHMCMRMYTCTTMDISKNDHPMVSATTQFHANESERQDRINTLPFLLEVPSLNKKMVAFS